MIHMISYHMILSYDMILENFRRTENRQTDIQRIQLQRPLLSPVDRRGERANFRRTENRQRTERQRIQLQRQLLSPVDRRGELANTTD